MSSSLVPPFERLNEYIGDQPDLVKLLVGRLAGDILVLIIRVQFKMFANREQATGVIRRGAPFLVFALIEDLRAGLGRRVVGTDGDPAFESEPVAISPLETRHGPIEVRAVAVGKQDLRK